MYHNLVSIIIPIYNRGHLIRETLDSILAQTYSNWECIVVDDGSTDNTSDVLAEYVKKDIRFQYYDRPKEKIKGPNSCRNYGFELSKGDYVKWFDSDDLMYINLLENQIKVINNNVQGIVCKLVCYDFKNNKLLRENKIYSDTLIEDYLVGNVSFYISGPLWKRSFLNKQNKLFDDHITNLDDWDFNLRMLYQQPYIIYLDEPLIKYRMHSSSLSHEIGKFNFKEIQSEFKAREKHLKLIKENKLANPKIIECYIKNRYKVLLRSSLIHNHKIKFYLLRKLLYKQIISFDAKNFVTTFFAFIIFLIFGKGYKLLK